MENGSPESTQSRKDTRAKIMEFQLAFNRPYNQMPTSPSVDDRLLLGKLLLEETLEFCCKGLGLGVFHNKGAESIDIPHEEITLGNFGGMYNPVEAADGLGDVEVVAHFCAHWLGFNLNAILDEIHESNMSKLDDDGNPIINGVTTGYKGHPDHPELADDGFDPGKPVGKILKSANYRAPNLRPILERGNYPMTEDEYPGHVASAYDAKVCRSCGTHIDSLRPE